MGIKDTTPMSGSHWFGSKPAQRRVFKLLRRRSCVEIEPNVYDGDQKENAIFFLIAREKTMSVLVGFHLFLKHFFPVLCKLAT